MNNKTFGSFINQKRVEKEITLRGFANLVGLSPVYICYIEKGTKPAPTEEYLEKMINMLHLNKAETDELYDLAARSKSSPTVSGDLPGYIMEKDIVRVALRTAKEVDATDEEWQEFIEKINKRHMKMEGE